MAFVEIHGASQRAPSCPSPVGRELLTKTAGFTRKNCFIMLMKQKKVALKIFEK
jgi:hypothetical protein